MVGMDNKLYKGSASWVVSSSLETTENLLIHIVIGSQVSKPCSFWDTCSSVGFYRCHSTLLSFLSVRLIYSALQNENRWNANKSYVVGGEHLPYLVFPRRYGFLPHFSQKTN